MADFLLSSPAVSLVLCALICVVLGRSHGARAAIVLLGVVFLVAVILGATSIAWQAALCAASVMLLGGLGESAWPRRIAVATVTCSVLAAVAFDQAVEAHQRQLAADRERELAALRMQFPLTSVAARLQYETRNRSGNGAAGDAKPASLILADEVERTLASNESFHRTSTRGQSLKRIHHPDVVGSGMFDARYRADDEVFLSSLHTISLSQPAERHGCGPEKTPEPEYVPIPSPGAQALPLIALRQYHGTAAGDFLDPARLGYVEDREHVAGFEPHAFHRVPVLNRSKADEAALKMERLELVSLRKPSGPYAYVSDNYPRLDDLQKTDTRLLHDFETRALSQLRTADDVVIEETDGVVRMLGALRAGNDCLRCHSVRRGELIGAFAYEFLRKDATMSSPQVARQSE